jgi:oligopeptide/dipeptide ABC transporter ATP-binding protein
MALLSIQELGLEIKRPGSHISVLHGVNLQLHEGEIVGLVGETGSGKTLTAMSILQLLPPGAHFTQGAIYLDGIDLLTAAQKQLQQVRGRKIGAIFQQPRAALNPTRPVGAQVADRFIDLLGYRRADAGRAALELLGRVGIPDPKRRGDQYPHQLSGGMCQRVMVAMAIAAKPRLLLADEPTTGLDVTLQEQILQLIRQLAAEEGMAVLLITHDLAVVAQSCQRVAVMYAGSVVETGATQQVLYAPRHPYTVGLVQAVTSLEQGQRPQAIAGIVPRFRQPPGFCAFAERCPHTFDLCRSLRPPLLPLPPGGDPPRSVACHLYPQEAR